MSWKDMEQPLCGCGNCREALETAYRAVSSFADDERRNCMIWRYAVHAYTWVFMMEIFAMGLRDGEGRQAPTHDQAIAVARGITHSIEEDIFEWLPLDDKFTAMVEALWNKIGDKDCGRPH
jgi:hypothetical protein